MSNVLFVDDEYMILSSLKRSLIHEPYEKYYANSAEEALKIMEEVAIGVLVTDMKMPGINGLELLKRVKEKYPDVVKIVLSGYTSLPQVLVTVNQGDIFKFIAKPWEDKEFREIIQGAVDYYTYRADLKKAMGQLEIKSASFESIFRTYDASLLEIKAEMNLLQVMNAKLFKETLRLISRWDAQKESKEHLMETLMLLQGLLTEFSGKMPATTKRFSAKQVVTDIENALAERELRMTVDFGIDSQSIGQFKGRYEVLLVVFRRLLQTFIIDGADTHVGVILSSLPAEDQHALFRVVVQVEQRWFAHGDAQQTAQALFKDLAGWLAGDFSIMDLGDKKVMVFTALCAC